MPRRQADTSIGEEPGRTHAVVTLAEGCQLPSLSVAVTVKKRLHTQTPLCQTAVLLMARPAVRSNMCYKDKYLGIAHPPKGLLKL